MAPTQRLTLANDPADLVKLTLAAQAFLDEQGVPADVGDTTQLALEEIVTNVIKYAYDDDAPHRVEVSMAREDGVIVLCVEDDGRPFDPLQTPPPALDEPVEERSIGGLGIHLVRQLVDQLSYERVGDRNRVEMRIALPT